MNEEQEEKELHDIDEIIEMCKEWVRQYNKKMNKTEKKVLISFLEAKQMAEEMYEKENEK